MKVSVRVRDNPVVMQWSEDERVQFDNPSETEQLLEVGFHSRSPITPITGVRFRAETPGETASIDWVLYG